KDRLQRLAPAVTRAVEGAAVRLERRQLEEQLQQSQRMEAVGRLAGGIAHDFNNVLTAVLGSIELLLLDAPPDRPHREELDIIRDAATRAKDLIRQLLAFSARQVLQPMVVDLNRLVKDIAKLRRRLAMSLTRRFRSTTIGCRTCRALKASSWRIRSLARVAASRMMSSSSRCGRSGGASSNSSSIEPSTAVRTLLKSWAIPPASRPTASIRCECCSCSSSWRRSRRTAAPS